jgi:hemolysin type calcium-binding protein/peptidase S24-like protein
MPAGAACREPMKPGWARRGFGLGLSMGLAWVVWPTLGPSQLGGPATYAVVAGSSMAPVVRAGDLVLLRPAPNYVAGQIVGYRTTAGDLVLHRVIGRVGEGYAFQGDNNSWVDPYLPTRPHLVGRLRWRLAGVGRVIEWLRAPFPAALVVGLASFLVGAGRSLRSERWRQRHRSPPADVKAMRVRLTLAPVVCIGALLAVVTSALTARILVPETKLDVITRPARANDLKPTACVGIDLQRLVVGSGTVQGSTANELILASPTSDRVLGRGGDDCLVAGGGNDVLTGGAGNDVCLGGPGTDAYSGCEITVD